jgi:carbon-monoxide dehydrogenase medium subunit
MSAGRYIEPATIAEAVNALAQHEGARCLAGGQTLVAMMNGGLVAPAVVVGLRRVAELRGIEAGRDGSLAIGAMTTHAALAREPRLTGAHALLREAASVVAHPAIRNLGTLGGALCHGDPNADYPAAILALDADIEVVGPGGARSIPASDFFVDFLTTTMEPGELLTRVRLPPSPTDSVGVYEKFARVDGDYATVAIALVLRMARGTCAEIRVAIGACGPTPIRVPEAEQSLLGTRLDSDVLARAGQVMADAVDPIDDVRGSAAYRRMLVPRLFARAVARALAGDRGRQ